MPEASAETEAFIQSLTRRNPHQPEFLQAAHEVVEAVMPHVLAHPELRAAGVLERLTEPDRAIAFRVTWQDDAGRVQVNRGWRIQFNNAIGVYKGGLRFHRTVNESVLKFLGFEQIFKNALTGLPIGGGKGGSDFDPKGKSDHEVMRFCQSFMNELYRHIGPDIDVPAGDIGVGGREIGYLFGQYKRLHAEWSGTLTGKGLSYGGSNIRPEATGYGLLYFVHEMLARDGSSVEGKRVVISGSGNVAQYAAEKAIQLGGRVLAMSDSGGVILDKEGIDEEKLAFIMDLKENRRGRIREFADAFKCEFRENGEPWTIPCDIALPCATQNELDKDEARALVKNGVKVVAEGANMPCTPAAVHILQKAGVLFGPAKACNAGGVACSGLELSQNSLRVQWSREEVDARLRDIMRNIHQTCLRYGHPDNGEVDYVRGANLGGFVRVADAMLAQGLV